MDLLVLFIIATVIGAGLLVLVIGWTTNRAAESAITRYFKASEYILETGDPPPEWYAIPLKKRLLGTAPAKANEETLLNRLDDMIRFFEGCSFYEDDYARDQHLTQLKDIRQAWRQGNLS
jgi:hypothetical protein